MTHRQSFQAKHGNKSGCTPDHSGDRLDDGWPVRVSASSQLQTMQVIFTFRKRLHQPAAILFIAITSVILIGSFPVTATESGREEVLIVFPGHDVSVTAE
jgi:hypothetical protein